MSFYAVFDSNKAEPRAVIGWLDTDYGPYPNMPDTANLLELTPSQWADHDAGGWEISQGILIRVAPALQSLAARASDAIDEGFTVTLTGGQPLEATLFACDLSSQAKLAVVTSVVSQTGHFPNGADTYPLRDKTGAWHTVSIDQYNTVASSIATYVAFLVLIIDGNPLGATTLPTPSATLTTP